MKMKGWRQRSRILAARTIRFLASERCFYIIVICFVLQAVWLAATARYPMAFDENFHFGLIQLHAKQWLPFFTHQPADASAYGAVARDPSYLYHFLLSIPYRGIQLLTSNTTAQIIILRLLNIALFTYGIVLFRRLLIRIGGSRPLVHMCMLLFSLLPIVPFLAAQINYDNLLFPLTAGAFLMVIAWSERIRARQFDLKQSALLISVLLLACLIKYAFLPILGGILAVMLWQLWRTWHTKHHPSLSLRSGLHTHPIATSLAFLLIIGSVCLFSERYVINMWRYHTPVPDCGQVLSTADCLQYSPWQRDYYYAQQKPAGFKPNIINYADEWVYGMWQRSLFAVSDTYVTMPPLPAIAYATAILGIFGGIIFLWYARRILISDSYRQYIFAILAIYTFTLFVYIYRAYAKTGVPVAINGRYLVPILPIIFLYAGLGFSRLIRKHQSVKAAAAVLAVCIFLQGGGALTFTIQSDQTWNWQSGPVVHANNAARKVLHPLIPGSRKP